MHPLLRSAQYADLTGDPGVARAALMVALRRVDAGGGFGWPDGRSPFLGLRALDVEDHRVFFGREGEVQRLVGCCGLRLSGRRGRCCWWWAPRGVASRRWCGLGCCM